MENNNKKNMNEIAKLTIIVTETKEGIVNIECSHEGHAKDRLYKIGLLTTVIEEEKNNLKITTTV